MIIVCNILTKTKNHDVYDEVAVNKYPIVIIDDCEDVDRYCDEFGQNEFMLEIVKKHVKNDVTFDNAKLYLRFLDDSTQRAVMDRNIVVSEKITKEQWKN